MRGKVSDDVFSTPLPLPEVRKWPQNVPESCCHAFLPQLLKALVWECQSYPAAYPVPQTPPEEQWERELASSCPSRQLQLIEWANMVGHSNEVLTEGSNHGTFSRFSKVLLTCSKILVPLLVPLLAFSLNPKSVGVYNRKGHPLKNS